MTINQPLESLLCQIHEMDHQQCIEELVSFRDIPLDFQPGFLEGKSIDWLRHVLAAAVLTTRKRQLAA